MATDINMHRRMSTRGDRCGRSTHFDARNVNAALQSQTMHS